MEGYRTYIVGAVMLVIAIVNNLKPGLVPFGELEVNAALTVIAPLAMIAMRKITKAPPAV